MPTAYLKKLAKLNKVSVNKLEKFWAQAKEIAKSEGQGKAWGLITSIFQNRLKKEGYKVKASISLADTDELDDADLGLNVDPKEYHKQKSLQMSLKSKLDMIKKDLNKEANDYNRKLVEYAEKLNKENRDYYTEDNAGDNWLRYDGPVTEKVLEKAFSEGFRYFYFKKVPISDFRKGWLKEVAKPLLNKRKITVYRGLSFSKENLKDKNIFKYLKYNLMDRNSWTTSLYTAEDYANSEAIPIILRMTCSLKDVNLPLSAFLEGVWYYNDNKEVNIRKSLKIENIKIIKTYICDKAKKFLKDAELLDEFNKVTAFKEETREVDDIKSIFKRLSLSDCVKQIKDLFDDYFNLGKKDPEYYEKLHNTKVDESTASDLLSDDTTVYIEYNDGSKWYSVDNSKLKDLKLTGIKNCIIEYTAYTAYFGKDCRIEKFYSSDDAPYVIKSEAKMKQFKYKGQIITASSKEEAIQQIVSSTKILTKNLADKLPSVVEIEPINADYGYDIYNKIVKQWKLGYRRKKPRWGGVETFFVSDSDKIKGLINSNIIHSLYVNKSSKDYIGTEIE